MSDESRERLIAEMLAALKYVREHLGYVDGPWKQIVNQAIEKAEKQ